MSKNKFLSMVLILFCVIIFAGCANVEYQRIVDDTGKIVDRLVVEINEEELAEKLSPEKINELKEDIKKDFKSYVLAINNAKDYLEANNRDTSLNYKEGITIEHTDWTLVNDNTYRIILQMAFLDVDYYNALYSSGEEKEENTPTEIVKGMFISKYVMYSNNVFANMEEVSGGMDSKNYFEYYSAKYGEFSVDDLKLTQIYGTTDKRLKSDADYVENIEGINYHLWEIDANNANYKTAKLSYYYTTAVGTGWYIVALGVSIALAIFLIMVYAIKALKNRKYRKKVSLEGKIAEELERDE